MVTEIQLLGTYSETPPAAGTIGLTIDRLSMLQQAAKENMAAANEQGATNPELQSQQQLIAVMLRELNDVLRTTGAEEASKRSIPHDEVLQLLLDRQKAVARWDDADPAKELTYEAIQLLISALEAEITDNKPSTMEEPTSLDRLPDLNLNPATPMEVMIQLNQINALSARSEDEREKAMAVIANEMIQLLQNAMHAENIPSGAADTLAYNSASDVVLRMQSEQEKLKQQQTPENARIVQMLQQLINAIAV